MTRHGFVLGVALAAALAACGGSSSETPPPLQPDPQGFHYAGVTASVPEASDAGSAPASADSDDDEKPHAPARATWGGNTPHH
ncbi:MAG TPA: hypothetical protein VK745_14475 [Polyangiaceae bacterium]|jgi:hypothetical protein|nr:hypothetical protein [Polyangiaceae bacterium]